MPSLKEISKPVEQHLKAFNRKFRVAMKSKVPLLNIITRYILKRKGKQIRPLFVFLSAEVCGGTTESSFTGASLIELLHTASLVHDDVIDESFHRRGMFSVNALWKNKIAVLAGDYLLSKGLLIAIENNEFNLLRIVSEATREMSEGELLQLEKARKLDMSEDIYFEIIRKKTASLIASCCAIGAASAGADQQMVRQMHTCGQAIGIAFQIKDDLMDFDMNSQTGKPRGLDIKEKKMTLPLIYMLGELDYLQRQKIIHLIKYNRNDQEKVKKLVEQVKISGGIDYAVKKMMEYQRQAIDILSAFPESEAKKSLKELIRFTIERKR